MLIRTSLFALTLTLTLPAAAQVDDCTTATTQADMNICADQDFQTQDADLNDAYASAKDILQGVDADLAPEDQGAAQALLDAQRAWITYRDAGCKAEAYLYEGGSMRPMVYSSCLARVTAARAQDLWKLAE